MKDQIDRRSFLKIAGASLGIGVVYQFAPFADHRLYPSPAVRSQARMGMVHGRRR
jgi:hypothetical protein